MHPSADPSARASVREPGREAGREPVRESGREPTTAAEAPGSSLVTEVLELLLEAGEDGRPMTADGVVARVPAAAGAVASALDRLEAEGATVSTPDGGLRLTDAGRDRAVVAVRRHRLTERLLSDVLRLEWWKVHHEAVRWEGVVSSDVEARLVDVLGDPGTCPHGNPIPGSANRPDHTDAVLLADVPVGPVHVVRITESLEADDEALQLLQACGFLPGRDAEVVTRRDGWVEVAGTVHDAALPPHIATNTYVAPR